ncbi:MAG: ASCH domain-containing protein [Planctomycetes bacterium]|nr:ASCH domain-containing protein [Planctomycetota bacterium]
MAHHLVILHKPYLDAILKGTKTTECRLSQTRRVPFGSVRKGDILWFKQSGGPIRARARAGNVTFLHPLGGPEMAALQKRYHRSLRAEPAFFERHKNARFATLIRLKQVRPIEPIRFRKSNRLGWVVLPESPTVQP